MGGFARASANESIGIYAGGEVRGFSASDAGNNRIQGIYAARGGWHSERQAIAIDEVPNGFKLRAYRADEVVIANATTRRSRFVDLGRRLINRTAEIGCLQTGSF